MTRRTGDQPTWPSRRAVVSFWFLVVIATAASGSLMTSLKAPASPAAGLGVALSGSLLAVALLLAGRVLLALERARRNARSASPRHPDRPRVPARAPARSARQRWGGRTRRSGGVGRAGR